MTIVCWDGKRLASDSRLTHDGVIMTDEHKKIYNLEASYKGDSLFYIGMAGVVADWELVLDSLEKGEPFDNHDVGAIVIGDKYNYTVEPECSRMIRYEKHIKLAVGSGMAFAISAMSLGKTSVEAVEHTIKHCTCCGGNVQIARIL